MPSRQAWIDALVVAAAGCTLYAASGALGAYFARDDFQWLNGARTMPVSSAFEVGSRTHFYRPAAELWWAGTFRLCGTATTCYHAIELGAHILNALLFLWLTRRLFGRRLIALSAATVFVVMPAYVQAVVWVCAVTTVLCVFFFLLCLHASLSASERDHAGWHSALAIACAAGALYTHESAATLALIVPVVVYLNPNARRRRLQLVEIAGFAVLAALFAVTTYIANSRNYVFTEGHYAVGRHALGHGLDYLRVLYVGRLALPDYVGVAAAVVAIVAAGTPPLRGGLAWMILTMLPFLSFTWGNVGRYTYLPAMGFAWMSAGVIAAAYDALRRLTLPRIAQAVAAIMLCAIALRFAAFSRGAIAQQVAWMEHYRDYAVAVTAAPGFRPESGSVVVPAPAGADVEREYVAPMLQWVTNRPSLAVRFGSSP